MTVSSSLLNMISRALHMPEWSSSPSAWLSQVFSQIQEDLTLPRPPELIGWSHNSKSTPHHLLDLLQTPEHALHTRTLSGDVVGWEQGMLSTHPVTQIPGHLIVWHKGEIENETLLLLDIYATRIGTVLTQSKDRAPTPHQSQGRDKDPSIALWEIDLDTNKLHAGHHLATLLERPHNTLEHLDDLSCALTPETLDWLRIELDAIRSQTSTHFHIERSFLRLDGSVAWLSLRGQQMNPTSGRVLGFAMDITKEKSTEMERDRLATRLENTQHLEALGRLAEGIAHDFNNLLSVIIGSAVMMRDDDPSDTQREDIQQIIEAAERAAGLTNQLLAFGRKKLTTPRAHSITTLVERLQGMVTRLIGEDITLEFEIDAHNRLVLCERTQIEQILINLIVNARDALRHHGSNILVRSTLAKEPPPGAEPGDYALLEVSDDGQGIANATLERIFEPFFTTKSEGTGLGLATVFGIVQQNQGHIFVDSKVGQGSTFSVYLPLCDARGELTITQPMSTQTRTRLLGATVLLVEDDPNVRNVMERVLEREGLHVLVAGSPIEALFLCEEKGASLDLILTDVIMPQMNGVDLAQRLRELRPDLRVIFMSGYTKDRTDALGVLPTDPVLAKPIPPQTLIDAIHATLLE